MKTEVVREIRAPAARVWALFADVERWPDWTSSVSSAERLSGEGLANGRFRLKQPGFPRMVWRVTEVDEGRAFTWETRSPGSLAVARHALEETPGGVRVTLTVEQTGVLGSLVARLMARRTRSFVAMEADGLKRRAESGP